VNCPLPGELERTLRKLDKDMATSKRFEETEKKAGVDFLRVGDGETTEDSYANFGRTERGAGWRKPPAKKARGSGSWRSWGRRGRNKW